eukprot:TRINITY_DN1462_c6_g1_i1.p1 TRINITY_DN1462_c6_g1~~TRINITY_DN1462_c6_g1_i1.p1  ORF type:complete len:200 (+),score=42.79 TRINITY_DN1462_c6_g1_i1:57-602(+)
MATIEDRKRHEAALTAFETDKHLTSEVMDVIQFIGETGCNCYPWKDIQPVIKSKVCEVLGQAPTEMSETEKEGFEMDKESALKSIQEFHESPFTLQRLCEVLTDKPTLEGRKGKLMWALLKLLNIRSTLSVDKFLYEQQPKQSDCVSVPAGVPLETDIPLPDPAPAVAPTPETPVSETPEN